MSKQFLATCHSCGKDYQDAVVNGEAESCTFDICFECRKTKPLFAIILDGDPETIVYTAGVSHTAERILDESYWDFNEFNDEEYKRMEAEGFADYESELDRIRDNGGSFEELQSAVKTWTDELQALWTAGVAGGWLTVNNRPRPGEGGETFRIWPTTFKVEVHERKLSELIECGVCAEE